MKNRTRLPFKVHNINIATELIPIKLKHWPNCPSISLIHDQGECGSCWAVAATEVMSNRICIHSNNTKQVNISVQHLIPCCTSCGIGCSSNDIIAAWKYYKIDEIVYGGHYNLQQDCQLYLLSECAHTGAVNGTWLPCSNLNSTPTGSNKCETDNNDPFNDDKHNASHVYSIENKVTSLQYEIIEILMHEIIIIDQWKATLLVIFSIISWTFVKLINMDKKNNCS